MQPEKQPLQGTVSICLGWASDGTPAIIFTFPPSAFIEVEGGDPRPGIVMTPAQAREYAYAMLLQAEQLASRSVVLPPRPPR